MDLENCVTTYIHHYNILWSIIYCSENSLHSSYSYSHLSHSWQPLIFLIVYIVFHFLKCHAFGITKYTALFDWLLSRSHIHLWFFCVFSRLDGSFVSQCCVTVHCLHGPQFVYQSPTDGNLGYLLVLTIMNKAAINFHVHVFV